jgi:hypothetical protein
MVSCLQAVQRKGDVSMDGSQLTKAGSFLLHCSEAQSRSTLSQQAICSNSLPV